MTETVSVVPPLDSGEAEGWNISIAGKKIVWAMASWKAAVAMGTEMAPMATAFIVKVSDLTAPYGITLLIDKPVFESMLPVLAFASLIIAHDFAKVKTGSKWL